jgi:hypothetical protein
VEKDGGYRRDHLRALAQRVEVDGKEVRIMGSKKRTAAHARRCFKRKNGAFRRSLFLYRSGAPRSMKMGTIRSLWRYDAGAGVAP